MKADKAPEKIYLDVDVHDDLSNYWFTCKPSEGYSVEYIRTDTFINKVCDYLRTLKYQDYSGGPMLRLMDDAEIDKLRKKIEE